MPKRNKHPRGFIALTSAIIISAMLLVVAASGSLTGFFSRMNIIDSELKERSSALAESCVDQALLELTNNPTFVGPKTVPVGGSTCVVQSVTTSGVQKTIKTQGVFNNYYTNLQVTVLTSDLSVVSWQEVTN